MEPTNDINKILEEYVATANNPAYNSDFNVINSKFPELKGYDPKLLEEYVATANNPEYNSDFNIINSKFPELFQPLKKKEPTYPGLRDAFGVSLRGPLMEKSNLPPTTKKVKQPLKSDLKAEELKSIETNLAKENVDLTQLKQKITTLEKSGKLQDPTIQAEYNGLISQYNEKAKNAKTQFDKYQKERGNYRSLVRDEQNADLKKGINTSKGILNKINTYDATLKQVGLRYGQTQVALEEALQAGDNEAAAQLQGQLKKDEAIIKNLDELIKTGKRVAAAKSPDNAVDGFYIGVYQTIGQLMQGPKFLDEGIKRLAYQTTTGKSSKDLDKYFENRNTISDKIAAAGKIVSEFASERSDEMKINRAYSGSATKALLNQDYGNAASFIYKDFLQNLPSSLSYLNPATATAMTVGAVGEEMSQAERDGRTKDYNVMLAGAIKGGLEIVTERWLGAGKAGVKLIKKLGREGAEQAIRQTTEQLVKKTLGRKLVEMQGEEVVGETINLIGSNLTDIYLNGRKDITPTTGISDNALNAVFGSVVQGGPATTLNHYIDKARIKEAEDLKSQATNYMEQSMLQQNPAAAQVLEEKANNLNLEAQNIVDREQEIALNANPETMDAIIALENDKYQLEEALQEEGLPEEVSAVIEEKLSTLQVEHNELIVQATKEAEQNIKAEEEEISQPIDVTEFLKGDAKEEIEVIKEESTKSSKPSESDKNYEESQEVNRIVSKENPNASVLIQPKGNDLVLTAIYVGKEKRGGGIGTKVLESVKEQADKLGKKVVLDATNELDQETDLVRLGNFYEKNGFKKVGENKYEYDPKAEVSSGDIGTRNNDTGPKESDITAGNNKGEPSENVNVSTKEEPQVETEKPILAESTPSENITNKQNKNENTNEKTDEGSRIQKDGEKGNEVVTEGVQNAREKGRQDVNQQEQEELLSSFDFNKLIEEQKQLTEKEKLELEEAQREEAYQKSSFDKKWAKTYKEAKKKLVEQYNKAKSEKEEAESKTYKSAGTKSVFVGGELDGNFISINAINEKKRQDKIKNAQSDMDSAKKDLKSLGLKESEIEELLTNKQQEDAVSKGKEQQSNQPEYKGTDGQQQGEQEDRTNQEGNVPQSQVETINRNQSAKSRKEQKVKSKLTPDEAISNLEGIKEKEVKPKEAKPKKKKLPSKKALEKLEPETPSDFIALALANTFISTDSFNNASDRNNLKVEGKKFPSVRMNYLRKNGVSLDQLVIDLANDKVAFPFEMSQDAIRKRIIGFMLDNPNGPNSYAKEVLDIPNFEDAEQEYYNRKQAEYEQMLSEEKEQREAELDAIETAWSQLESDIETLSEEDIDKILSLMAEDDYENINNIIESNNEKQDIGGKENASVVVSENEGSKKGNTGKSREELEAKVKEKKSAVDKAQNALSKAKANLEKAVSESQRDIFGKAEVESKLFAADLKSLNKAINEKEGILALAKESLQKANDELNSWTPENQTKISFDNAITLLNSLKVDTKNKSFDAILGLPVLTWNAAIDTITKAIEAGVTVSDAIKRGLNYIQKNHRGAWDKKSFNTKVIEELGLRGIEVNGEDLIVKPVEKEFASVVDGFYSDLEQSLLDTKKDNLSGAEWISTLGNSDEAKWTGLSDWLNSQEGKVSKSDIRNYLKGNKIEVVEVIKGTEYLQREKQYKDSVIKKANDLGLRVEFDSENELSVRDLREGEITFEEVETDEAIKRNSKFYEISEDKLRAIRDLYLENKRFEFNPNAFYNESADVKFEQYQLEGNKENYKEILVTMPSKEVSYSAYKFDPNNDSGLGAVEGDWIIKNNRGEDVSFVESDYAKTAKEAMQEFELNQLPYEKYSENMLGKEVKFQSTHFEEPNILVHLRMNTRTDSEGNKVLFLEEIQSDWGQTGKKEGFIDELVIPEGLIRQNNKGEWRIANIYDPKVKFDTKEKAEAYYRENYNLGKSSKIISAPFVTDTNDWTKLGLKVALKEAVRQGADKIAWTTGEQQIERYDLSKQVDEIRAKKNDDGTYKINAAKGGNNIFAENNVSANKLQDIVGKELAQKIIEDKSNEGKFAQYKGQDLKVGGKGMIGFYGSPKVVKESKSSVKNIPVFRGVGGKINATYGKVSDDGMGVFYTDNETMAKWFAGQIEYSVDTDKYENQKSTGEVLKSKLTLKNPYVVHSKDEDYDSFQTYMGEIKDAGGVEAYKDNLISKGHDGIILKDNNTNYYESGTYDIFIQFENLQSQGSLGIVGNVAKSLFNQEPKTIEINKGIGKNEIIETNPGIAWNLKGTETFIIKGGKDFIVETREQESYYPTFEAAKNAAIKMYQGGVSTQNSIDITPELKASVELGLPLFGNIIKTLEKLKLDTKGKLNAFGIAPAIWNAGLDTIILAIKSGVALADAVQKGIQFFKDKNVEFDEAKVTAYLEEKVGLKRNKQQTNEKDKQEEPMLEEPRDGGDEGKKGSEGSKLRADQEGERKIRKHFKTIVNNESLKEAVKFMLENDFAYNVKSMDKSLSKAKAYLEKNGIEDSYNNFITYGEKIEGLTGDESIALAFLIQTMINTAMVKEIESGNSQVADELRDDFERMSEKIASIGTESGRVVNAYKLFLADMSNPISAQMALTRIAKKAENQAKASDSKERKKAESKTKAVTSEVNKGKKKAAQEVTKYAEEIAKEDIELGEIIFKGSKKPISDETKAKISDFFDNLIPDEDGMVYDGILGVSILAWKGFVIGVKKLVVDFNIPLINAIKQQYDAMVGEYGKETMDKVVAEFQKKSGTTPKEIAKNIQKQKQKESERIQKEKDTLEKELQKERDRVAKLRAKEKEAQEARIKEQSAKLALKEAQDAQKEVQKQLEAERVDKQKTLSKAKKEALDIELKAAEQKQKDAQKVLDLADAMALKIIQEQLKESQKKEKQLEKDIEKLGKELVRNRLFDDLVADLVDEYINMKGDTKNQDLIKLVEERLGIKGEKATKIANKIRESVYNNVTKRVSDRFEKEIETERKRREGTLKKADPKTGEQIVDELVFAINTRMMTADMMMDLFPSKYGMVKLTGEDFQKIRELSQAIATAPSAERKAIAIKNFLEYLYSFKPYYFAELMNELWYFDVLSGVLTIALSTGDVNNYYNFVQVASMSKEIPAVAIFQGIRRAFNEKKYNQLPSIVSDVLMSYTKALMQTLVRPTDNEIKTANSWIKLATKNGSFLSESRAAFEEAFTRGTASFTDFENPFKNSALGEFDILRVWDGAKKDLTKNKKGLAYLYWLAVEKVYNLGSSAWRLLANGPKGFIGLNQIVPQVGRTLAASDVFFSGILKNGYSAIVLREQLIKEGFKGAELEAELKRRLTNSEEELASAKYTAINWRMKYDIGFQQNSDGKWNIYDNGKVVSKFILAKRIPREFNTLEEAEDYARTVVAPSGSRYKLDIISQLNLKRGLAAIKTEKRIASFNLLTKASMGRTGQLLSFFNKMSQFFTELSNEISESASLSDKRAIRYAKNILATSVIYATHLFSFLKVGTGLSRMFSQYFTPIGLLRGFMADKYNKSLLGRNLDEEVSKVEVDMLYAKALMGLYPTYLVLTTMLRLKDDEDDDKEKKEVVITPEEEKFIANIEKRFGVKLDEKQRKLVTMVKPGDVVGNLQWMDPTMRRFFTNTKILVESSRFVGYDENGNRMWEGLSQDPSMIMAESYATMVWYNHLNKDKQDVSPITEIALHPLYKFIDLSIGQGIVKYFASKTTTENKFEALFQTLVLDMGGIFNPNILTGVMKYVDGKARKNETLFDYIDNQEDRNYFTALGAYTLDKVVPVKGAWYEATKAPIVYGQFGEEMFRVPSEKQGFFSSMLGYYNNKDKNLEQKAMNEFFYSIGRVKVYVPDTSPIIDENFKEHKLTPRQRTEYGMLAGRVSFEQFKKLTPIIQELYSKVGDKAANSLIDDVFVSNYKNMALLKLGLINQKDFDRLSTENIANQMSKAIDKLNLESLEPMFYEALGVTEKEKQLIEDMKKVTNSENKKAIFLKEMSKLKSEEEIIPYLERMVTLKVMSSEMFNELFNYKYLNGKIGANIPQRLEELEAKEED